MVQGKLRSRPLDPSSVRAQDNDVDIVTGLVKGEVTHAAGHVEGLAGWIEDNSAVGIWNLHYLLLDRSVLRNVVDEHVLFRVRQFKRRAVGVVNAVVPASQDQQSLAIRTHYGGDRLPGQPGWIVGQIGVHGRSEER